MRKERQVELIERLLSVLGKAPEEKCRESTLEVDRYTSESRFSAERRVLFRTRPIIVGRESDLAEPGSFFTVDAAGMPVLVARDHGGAIRAMVNVCRHRGTRLVNERRGSAKAFVCPYHAWTYDLAGNLGHVPHARTFPTLERDESSLSLLPSAVRHGFVWVLPTPSIQPIDMPGWLGAFDDDLAAFDLERHVVFAESESIRAANWKLVMDAFLEGYHVKTLHQRTLARFFRDDVVVDFEGPHVRSAGARRDLPEVMNRTKDAWDLRASATVFYNLFPNSILVFHPETVSHIALYPKSVGEVRFVHTMLAPREPASDEERSRWQRTWELIDGQVFAHEDLAIAENIQSVIHAGAQPTFRLGALEHAIRVFHDSIDAAIAQDLARQLARSPSA